MKKYALIAIALFGYFIANAQVASSGTGNVSTSAADSVNTLYDVMIMAGVILFIFIIIFALAKAVKALSTQVGQ